MLRRWLWLGLLLCPLLAQAVVETWEFDSDSQRQRYQQLIEELRCPKCQNQNLAGSDAEISADLRRELYRLLQDGRSDQEIIEFMVSRYGEFVLYRPPLDRKTAILWLAPWLMLLVGVVILLLILRRQRRNTAVAELSEADRRQLQQLRQQVERETADD